MIIVSGTITFDAAKKDAAKAPLAAVMAATQAEAGCQAYTFSFDIEDDGVLHLYELWDDMASIDTHMATPHMAEFLGKMGEFGVTGTDIRKYEATGGEPL